MQALLRRFACALLLAVALPTAAETPDPVLFAVRVEAGDLPAAEQWLKAGLDPDYEGDRIGSGLMIAAWEGNVPMMALFHRHGADVNRVNRSGEQALLHAAWKGRKDAVEWLLAHGAQLNRAGRHWSALHYATFAGNEDIVRLLIDHGADVNALAPNGSSVLMMAAREGYGALAQLLLTHGANPTTRNDYYESATDWALRYGHTQIARTVATTEAFERAVQVAALAPPVVESEPAPRPLAELVEALREARAAGRPTDEVLQRYAVTLDALKH